MNSHSQSSDHKNFFGAPHMLIEFIENNISFKAIL